MVPAPSPGAPSRPVPRGRTAVVQVAVVGVVVLSAWASHRSPSPVVDPGGLGFRLTDVTAELGIDFQHRRPQLDERIRSILPQVAGTGAAVSVCDADGDGHPDLYATSGLEGSANALYVQRDGRFVDVAPEAGLAALNEAGRSSSHGSVWADLDGDGDQDVLVYTWGRQRLFRNDGELRFTEVSSAAGLDVWMNAAGGLAFDKDNDGDLDLLLAGYYREETNLWDVADTRFLHEDNEFARNGGRNRLFENRGDGTFVERTEESGLAGNRWTYGLAAADLDGDGRQDLYVANDYGSEEVWRNVDGTRFELWDGLGLDAESKSGMCVALGDVENRGDLAAYVTNISEKGYLFQGNNLRVLRLGGSGQQTNVASGASADCGWAWGADFGDLDGDGWQDLVVANGFRSANPDKDYWYSMTKLAGGAGGLIEDAANWPAFEDMSLSGYQRTRVLLNRGRNRFDEVAEAAGITDLFDGRSVAVVDLFDDGAPDVVVANQDGPLLVYSNERDNGNHWVGFRLRSTRSNPGAVGARVTVRFGRQRQTHVVTAGSGFCSQTDPRVLVGLGEREAFDEVEILWPSGQRQVLGALATDRYHTLEEPKP